MPKPRAHFSSRMGQRRTVNAENNIERRQPRTAHAFKRRLAFDDVTTRVD